MKSWGRRSASPLLTLHAAPGLPLGFGCVAFSDGSFPDFPRCDQRPHGYFFGNEMLPSCFNNQGGDPFLYQIYRRWSVSQHDIQKHSILWTGDVLSTAAVIECTLICKPM
jgi:hypothetical protein